MKQENNLVLFILLELCLLSIHFQVFSIIELHAECEKVFRKNECNYYVFLQQYGEFNVYPIEKNKDYFVVKGEPYQKFDFEIKCRQIGTDNMRLNRIGDKIESED